MLKEICRVSTVISAFSLLAACAVPPASVDQNASIPTTGNDGLVAFSVVCQSHHNDSSGVLQVDETSAGALHDVTKMIPVTCDNQPHYEVLILPVGNYKIDYFNIGSGSANMDITFSNAANHVTYVGRMLIDARGPTTSFGGSDSVYKSITNEQAGDLAYFESSYQNIPADRYIVKLAVQNN